MVKSKNEKKTQIVDAAKRFVISHGLKKITLEALASEIGMKPTALYYYFGSRDELVLEVLRQTLQESIDQEMTILEKPIPLRDRLLEVIDFHEHMRQEWGLQDINFILMDDLRETKDVFRLLIVQSFQLKIQRYQEVFSQELSGGIRPFSDVAAFSTLFVLGQTVPYMSLLLKLDNPTIICSQEALVAEIRHLVKYALPEKTEITE